MRSTDEPKDRARNVFRAMGLGIRSDDTGRLMIMEAAEVMAAYRDLDRAAAKERTDAPAAELG